MKIERVPFQQAFVQRAREVLAERAIPEPADSFAPSEGPRPDAFGQAVLNLNVASGLAGVPLLALVAQDVGHSLVTFEHEEKLSQDRRNAFQDWIRTPEQEPAKAERLGRCWSRIESLEPSPFAAPRLVGMSLVCAEADTREIMVGTPALDGELAQDDVLTFALAHEEAHRRHRDSAGCVGLETLVDCLPDAKGFQALKAGRHQNELDADLFAADVAARLGCAPAPILGFLLSCGEDIQHPDGLERASAVREKMAEKGQAIGESEWQRLVADRKLL